MAIGFIGLGAMGAPLATRLLEAGHPLVIHTRRREAAAPFEALGATWAATPRALAAEARTVFTMLPGPAEVEEVVFGAGGLSEGFAPGSTLIDMTTSAPSAVRSIGASLAKAGVDLLDAPVSGGPKGARTRRLAIWVSGPDDAFAASRPLLDILGDQVMHLGALGAATTAKLVHNCANYGIQMVLAEVFSIGVKAGVDPATLFAAIRQGSLGRQNVVDRLADQFLPGAFDVPSFALDLAFKDVSLAADLARENGVPARFTQMTLADMTEARNRGWGQRDSRVAMLVQEQRAGVDIRVERAVLDGILSNDK
ncbi:NAD(P)-dependent oxidoreductase [Xanthobacter autotrophicus]|uniref:NAD(P)-dependent oxidoreductase n=1 Tax=Xanthobacter autotrophicus TaxID=280 RepID=UPI00372646CB